MAKEFETAGLVRIMSMSGGGPVRRRRLCWKCRPTREIHWSNASGFAAMGTRC